MDVPPAADNTTIIETVDIWSEMLYPFKSTWDFYTTLNKSMLSFFPSLHQSHNVLTLGLLGVE